MKILIVDDQSTNRLVLKFLLEADGHECIEACDGQDGLEKFKQHAPDFVLMDIIMPVMDGYEATRELKKLTPEQYVPVIFLTAKHDEQSLLKCLESGGDDFLTKPFNDIMLKAKIRAHGRTRDLTSELVTKNEELTFLHNALQEEYEMGEHVINHARRRNIKDCPNLRSYLSPVSSYNGDILLSAYKPSGTLCFFLGDFTGHGLAASIGVVPLSHTFFSLCEKNLSASEMLREINRVLKGFLPAHMFCAGGLFELSADGQTLLSWSGGLPTAFVFRPGTGLIRQLCSSNIPLGIASEKEFNDGVDVIHLEHDDRVYLMTDGIVEAENSAGKMLGEAAILSAIESESEDCFDAILGKYRGHVGGAEQRDDISLVELTAAPSDPSYCQSEMLADPSDHPVVVLPWCLTLKFLPEDLKRLSDPAGQIMNLLPRFPKQEMHTDLIRTVVGELFANSLEHGLLKLDSRVKSNAAGFSLFYRRREEALESLTDGAITLSVSLSPDACNEAGEIWGMRIKISDSGSGFDHNKEQPDGLELHWGRGLKLIKSLCEQVTFGDQGREVEVLYRLS